MPQARLWGGEFPPACCTGCDKAITDDTFVGGKLTPEQGLGSGYGAFHLKCAETHRILVGPTAAQLYRTDHIGSWVRVTEHELPHRGRRVGNCFAIHA